MFSRCIPCLHTRNPSQKYIAIDPSLKNIYGPEDTGLQRDLSDKNLYLASSDVAYGFMEDVAADMQADFAMFKNRLIQTRETKIDYN